MFIGGKILPHLIEKKTGIGHQTIVLKLLSPTGCRYLRGRNNMGMYCCCGSKIRREGNQYCTCDWDGWISTCDYPDERKNKDTPIQKRPPKSGMYLIRESSDSGDRSEREMYFSETPIKIEEVGFFSPYFLYKFHWEDEEWITGGPYAWKEIPKVPK